MAQHDMSIANQGFPSFRSDLNDALQALVTNSSGDTAPTTTYANMAWMDTANNIFKIRNEDNDAWISVFTLNQSTDAITAIGSVTLADLATVAASQAEMEAGTETALRTMSPARVKQAIDALAPQFYGFKNRIINGAMMISQRGTSFDGLTNGGGAYTLDRWAWNESGTSTAVQTVSQDSSAPVGFVNSLKVQTTTAQASLSADNGYKINHTIEGLNVSDFAWGTANAQPVTLGFWVRSSLTGTFGGFLRNADSGRYYVFSYTINSADTWEYKTVTIAGDTSGTWLTNNSLGIYLSFSVGTGSTYQGTAGSWGSTRLEAPTGQVNVAGTLNATFYITGVQLEKGSTATSFDYRPYGTELALCQRYFLRTNPSNIAGCGGISGSYWAGTSASVCGFLPVQMRVAPSITRGGTSDTFFINGVNATGSGTFNGSYTNSSLLNLFIELNSLPSSSIGQPIAYNGQLSLSSEL